MNKLNCILDVLVIINLILLISVPEVKGLKLTQSSEDSNAVNSINPGGFGKVCTDCQKLLGDAKQIMGSEMLADGIADTLDKGSVFLELGPGLLMFRPFVKSMVHSSLSYLSNFVNPSVICQRMLLCASRSISATTARPATTPHRPTPVVPTAPGNHSMPPHPVPTAPANHSTPPHPAPTAPANHSTPPHQPTPIHPTAPSNHSTPPHQPTPIHPTAPSNHSSPPYPAPTRPGPHPAPVITTATPSPKPKTTTKKPFQN